MKDLSPQNAKVFSHLQSFGASSARELFVDCLVNSPRKRLSELQNAGVKIGSFWDESEDEYGEKHRYKRYFLLDNP